jgi:hypothetical protein
MEQGLHQLCLNKIRERLLSMILVVLATTKFLEFEFYFVQPLLLH